MFLCEICGAIIHVGCNAFEFGLSFWIEVEVLCQGVGKPASAASLLSGKRPLSAVRKCALGSVVDDEQR